MIREEKTIFVSVLTVLLLGFSNLLQTGKLLFTFPINDYLLLVVGGYLILTSLMNNLAFALIFLLFFLSNLLSNLYNYEFLFNQKQLEDISNNILTDVFQLLSYLFYLVILYQIYKYSKQKSILLIVLFAALFMALAELFSLQPILLLTYIIPFLWLTFFSKKVKENFYVTYLLLFLHVFLLITKMYTLYIA